MSHQYQNNHNTTIVGGQGATYNAPVSFVIPPNEKNTLNWVNEWVNHSISPNQDTVVVNQDCLRLYQCIKQYADERFSKQLHEDIMNACTNKAKIGTVTQGLSGLLKHARNRSVDHKFKKGIMAAIRLRYQSLKDIENEDMENEYMENEHEYMEDENMLQKAIQMSMENDNKEETIPAFCIDEVQAFNETNDRSASFTDFRLRLELIKSIRDAGFKYPFEAQISALPQALLGKDMIVQAKSGTGKTAVFILATLTQIQPEMDIIDTLVLCQTREMASQIFCEFECFSKYMVDVQIGCVYGGVPYSESKRVIEQENPHILIGTPGRIVYLLETSVIRLNGLKRFIIDECDNMFNEIDTRKRVQDIFRKTPQNKQVMMFSAIIGNSSKSVCKKFTKNAQEIFVDDKQLTLHGLQQHFVKLTEREKNGKLNDLLDALDFNQVVIFVRTKERAIELNELLIQRKFPSVYIHNDMVQSERLRLFKAFKQYKHRILVSTNLFGRGVDIERVNVVINYDMPQDSDEYFHRVSRAKDFGKCICITFVSNIRENQIINNVKTVFNTNVTILPNQIQTVM